MSYDAYIQRRDEQGSQEEDSGCAIMSFLVPIDANASAYFGLMPSIFEVAQESKWSRSSFAIHCVAINVM